MADDLRAYPLSAVCRHGVHVGLALLTFENPVFRAAKQRQRDSTGSDTVDAVLIPTLGAFDENIHTIRPCLENFGLGLSEKLVVAHLRFK